MDPEADGRWKAGALVDAASDRGGEDRSGMPRRRSPVRQPCLRKTDSEKMDLRSRARILRPREAGDAEVAREAEEALAHLLRARCLSFESASCSSLLVAHDLFRNPVSAFRDHALAPAISAVFCGLRAVRSAISRPIAFVPGEPCMDTLSEFRGDRLVRREGVSKEISLLANSDLDGKVNRTKKSSAH